MESIYRRIKIVNERNKEKYKHGAHLFARKKQLMSRERRASAPLLTARKIEKNWVNFVFSNKLSL